MQSKKKLAAQKEWEMHCLSNEEKEKWINDYVERETAVSRKRVEDAETAITQQQEDTTKAENVGLTTGEPEKAFHEMMVTIGDSLSYLASSNDEEDGEDEDNEDTEWGKLSEDDQPSWVMGTITKMVQQCMERFQQKAMMLDE